jgi:hypothetical protein
MVMAWERAMGRARVGARKDSNLLLEIKCAM